VVFTPGNTKGGAGQQIWQTIILPMQAVIIFTNTVSQAYNRINQYSLKVLHIAEQLVHNNTVK
jgi:predicted Fe-Mo cluster-binding NifX family protein